MYSGMYKLITIYTTYGHVYIYILPFFYNLLQRPPQSGKSHGLFPQSPNHTAKIKSHQINKHQIALRSVPYPTYGAGLYWCLKEA